MLSRNQSTQITSIGTLLFKSSNSIESSIQEYKYETAQESLGIDSEDNILNYNTKDDTLFIETDKRYYFIRYEFNENTCHFERKDKDVLPPHLDLTPFTATNILYNETERAYYCLTTKAINNILHFWLVKYDTTKDDLFIVFDTVNKDTPKSYIYHDGDNIKTINDFISEEMLNLEEEINIYENFIHNTSIVPEEFEFSFSFNNKLQKYLFSYILYENNKPTIYEHRFKVSNNEMLTDTISTFVYTIEDDTQNDVEEYATLHLNKNTQEWCTIQTENACVGKVALKQQSNTNYFIYYIIFDTLSGDFYSNYALLDENLNWRESGKEWFNFLNKETVFSLQYYIKSSKGKDFTSTQSEILFVNNELITKDSVSFTTEDYSYPIKGNFETYNTSFEDHVKLLNEETCFSVDITEHCTITSVVKNGEDIAVSPFEKDIEYIRTATVESDKIIGLDIYKENVINFSHPHRGTLDGYFIYEFYKNKYTITFSNNEQTLSIDPLNEAYEVHPKHKNVVEVQYADDEKTEGVAFTYMLNNYDEISSKHEFIEKQKRKPSLQQKTLFTTLLFDKENPISFTAHIEGKLEKSDFTPYNDGEEKTPNYFLTLNGNPVQKLDEITTDLSFVIKTPPLLYNTKYDYGIRVKYDDTPSFQFDVPLGTILSTIEASKIQYSLKYEHISNKKFWGNINKSYIKKDVLTVQKERTKDLTL